MDVPRREDCAFSAQLLIKQPRSLVNCNNMTSGQQHQQRLGSGTRSIHKSCISRLQRSSYFKDVASHDFTFGAVPFAINISSDVVSLPHSHGTVKTANLLLQGIHMGIIEYWQVVESFLHGQATCINYQA